MSSTGSCCPLRKPIRFMGCSRVVPRPCAVMTQVSRSPGTHQAGSPPSSPGISTSRYSRPRALPGSPRYSSGVRRTLAPGSRVPWVIRSRLRTTVSAVDSAPSTTGPTTAWTPGPSIPYVPGRSAVRERVRVICRTAVACTVSLRSVGRGRPGAALRAASLAYRPAATAAAPAPRMVVTAVAVAVAGRTASVSWGGRRGASGRGPSGGAGNRRGGRRRSWPGPWGRVLSPAARTP